jgi:TRAP-type mannitol/chloroaromatic compound transport system permease small subunit
MQVQRFLLFADRVSTLAGKAFAWIILLLTAAVCVEVFKRYILNAPTAWIFSADYMMYGTMFMMTGAYTLAQNGHVRGDFLLKSVMLVGTQPCFCLVYFPASGSASILTKGKRCRECDSVRAVL